MNYRRTRLSSSLFRPVIINNDDSVCMRQESYRDSLRRRDPGAGGGLERTTSPTDPENDTTDSDGNVVSGVMTDDDIQIVISNFSKYLRRPQNGSILKYLSDHSNRNLDKVKNKVINEYLPEVLSSAMSGQRTLPYLTCRLAFSKESTGDIMDYFDKITRDMSRTSSLNHDKTDYTYTIITVLLDKEINNAQEWFGEIKNRLSTHPEILAWIVSVIQTVQTKSR